MLGRSLEESRICIRNGQGWAPVLSALVCACLMLALPTICDASTHHVINTNDTGPGSLRDAIGLAVSNDTIVFDPGVTGTITLGSSLPTINVNLTITGPTVAPGITIDGASSFQIMAISAGITVTLNDLTLAHGSSIGTSMSISGVGGAIDNAGNLTVNNCSFISNKATGAAGTSIGMTNTAAGTGNGGAIFNETTGTLMIAGSTFSANIATGGNGTGTGPVPLGSEGTGGGIFNEGTGTVIITNSTFSGNQAIGGSPSAVPHITGGGLATGGAIISENLARRRSPT